jgi:anthranilate/para-aminobenzoate synthase component I
MLNISPTKEVFTENAKAGKVMPVYAELPLMSPRHIYESIASGNSFLLESTKGPEKIARYSFIGAGPFLTIKVKNGSCEISSDRKANEISKSPLKVIKDLITSYRSVKQRELPPFTGGAVGLISYDFVHYFERLPRTVTDDLNIPDAHFMLVDTVIAVDRKLQKTFIISCPGASETVTGKRSHINDWNIFYDDACEKIFSINKRIVGDVLERSGFRGDFTSRGIKEIPVQIDHEMGKKAYMDIVKRAKDYIKAGDIFQANLSQRVSAHVGDISPWQIYSVLSSINPAPFSAFLDMGEYSIVSSSPERLVRIVGDMVETRPIAGTRPRGSDAEGDRQMRADLLLNEKERAEHIMLIDLERNDLGKIADYSTVGVDELMITEDYSHVIHIVSNVTGKMAKGKNCFDAIRATFPGGTITGVPKVRCMEIIDELEPVTRGPYTGSIGYISFNGDMDLNIIIRTFVMKDQTAYVQAGAGIVADSDPEREYYETLKKAEALIKTLEVL